MKRLTRKAIREQLAMALVAGVFVVGLCLCVDESEDKAMSTYFLQALAGLGLIGVAYWLGKTFIRKGIVSTQEDKSEEL